MTISTKIIILLGIVVLWILGGQIKGRIRDIACPVLIGIGIWLKTKNIWIGIISILCYNIIRLGYGNYED